VTYLAIDVGGTFTKYAVMTKEGKFLEKGKFPTVKTSSSDFLDSISRLYQNCEDVKGIAISTAGVIDSEAGVMLTGGSLDFIENLPIVSILSRKCQIPVSVENDSKCAALAELWQGSLSDCQSGVAMILGTAVGGAVVIDRKILKGKDLLAGEFSYIMTDSTDSLNWKKNFAINGGVPGLLHLVADAKNVPYSEVSGELIFEWISSGDEISLECLRQYARLLATQIVNLHFVINPDRFAIGGGISEQPMLIQLIREEIVKMIANYPFNIASPEVVTCAFHNDANLLGALYAFLSNYENKSEVSN